MILDNISAFPTCVGPIYTLLVEIIFLKLVLEPTSNVLRSANVLVGKCPARQIPECLGRQMSGSANVWVGKCLDQVSKCQIGKCLDRQMSVMVSICPMSNVGRKMSGPGNVRPYNVRLPLNTAQRLVLQAPALSQIFLVARLLHWGVWHGFTSYIQDQTGVNKVFGLRQITYRIRKFLIVRYLY